jgi:hypothetical protein
MKEILRGSNTMKRRRSACPVDSIFFELVVKPQLQEEDRQVALEASPPDTNKDNFDATIDLIAECSR